MSLENVRLSLRIKRESSFSFYSMGPSYGNSYTDRSRSVVYTRISVRNHLTFFSTGRGVNEIPRSLLLRMWIAVNNDINWINPNFIKVHILFAINEDIIHKSLIYMKSLNYYSFRQCFGMQISKFLFSVLSYKKHIVSISGTYVKRGDIEWHHFFFIIYIDISDWVDKIK